MSSGPKIQPEGVAIPARPMGQTALSAAPNRRKPEPPNRTARRTRHRAKRRGPPAFAGFGAAERAVWPVGRAGTAAPQTGFWTPRSRLPDT
eukprot:15482769-Alexandrium_andersonii.AAC.1